VVYHKYSRTAGVFSPLKLYLVERNHYWAVLKTFPLPLLLLVAFYTLCRFMVQARLVLTGAGSGGEFRSSGSMLPLFRTVSRALLHALLGIPRVLAQRRKVMRTRRLSAREFARLLARYRLPLRKLLDD
jgi:hypothetical protein